MSRERDINYSGLTFQTAILDSLAAHIAVLDSRGMVVAVNLSWQEFADENGLDDENLGIGSNFVVVSHEDITAQVLARISPRPLR